MYTEKVAKWLLKKRLVSEVEIADAFLGGLPKNIRETLLADACRTEKREEMLTYMDIFKCVQMILNTDDFISVSTRRWAKENDEIERTTTITTATPTITTATPGGNDACNHHNLQEIMKQISQLQITISSLRQQQVKTQLTSTFPTNPSRPDYNLPCRIIPVDQPAPQQTSSAPHFLSSTYTSPQNPCLICKGRRTLSPVSTPSCLPSPRKQLFPSSLRSPGLEYLSPFTSPPIHH